MFAGELHHVPNHVAFPVADPIVGGLGLRAGLQADGWGEVRGSTTHTTTHTHTYRVRAHTHIQRSLQIVHGDGRERRADRTWSEDRLF